MRGDDEYKALEKALDNLEKNLGRVLTDAERTLFEKLVARYTVDLNLKGNRISKDSRVGNIVDDVFLEFDGDERKIIIRALVAEMVKVMDAGATYFKVMGVSDEDAKTQTEKIMKSVGLEMNQKNFKLIAGSYLDSITRSDEVKLKVMKLSLNAVFGESSYSDFLKNLRGVIETSPQSEGALSRYYKTFAYDLIQRSSRVQGNQLSKTLGLIAFIYSGTVIDNTRKFCMEKAGKVFTRDEAEEWQKEEWTGKTDPYVPLRDLGGYNCRHRVRWISNQEAIRRRPELQGKI